MTVDRLRDFGHDVKDIRGTVVQGLGDPGLWSMATTEGRLLITTAPVETNLRPLPTHER